MYKEVQKKLARNWFKILQDVICNEIEILEKRSTKFTAKNWNKSSTIDEGGGEYRILKNGRIFEKVGVNFSEVYGKFPKEMRKNIPGAKNIPNTRYIYTTFGWFGGGIDITPCINDPKEKKWFHNKLKKMCNRHNKNYYKKYKKWCDKYFYLPHRKETRGIGGIFFDYKKENWEKDFVFVRDVGLAFKTIFKSIIQKKYKKKWSLKEKELQYIKRGRYAEFNLLYDRGTKFGLQTGGNVEGILMSLPPITKWK